MTLKWPQMTSNDLTFIINFKSKWPRSFEKIVNDLVICHHWLSEMVFLFRKDYTFKPCAVK
jgi:hypothetical protein